MRRNLRNLAEAEQEGDAVAAARAKLHYADQMLAWIEPQYKAGYRATPQDYEKAKLARDVARTELEKLEQAQHVEAGSPATGGNTATTIKATGTIEPCGVVDVVAQVAGKIVSFGDDPRSKTDPSYKGKTIDYGSPVEEGTVLARIDDAIYKTRVELEKAKCERAEAELAAARAKAKEKADDPAIIAAQAAVAQAKAALKEAEINLDRTVIRSPVTGFVLARQVNVGQNVAPDRSSSLFVIAKGNPQVWAQVNESDISRILKGMEATFTADEHPKDIFKGTVSDIRRNPTMTRNVVTYTVVIVFANPGFTLMPYQTVNVQFPAGAETPPSQAREPPLQFGPVIERAINALTDDAGGEGLNLANGKSVDVPREFLRWTAEQRNKWSAKAIWTCLLKLQSLDALNEDYWLWFHRTCKWRPFGRHDGETLRPEM